jgi:gliding motility-associated protein GldM
MSPRQRMINLMYIVLTAMLALNVSGDVLNGFILVQEGVQRTNKNLGTKNDGQFSYLTELYEKNPTKAGPWYAKGVVLHNSTDSLYGLMEDYKMRIARQADGAGGDYNNLQNLDDLEAASVVMLDPLTQRGKKLREKLDEFRASVLKLIPDSTKRSAVEEILSTKPVRTPGVVTPLSWEQKMFEGKPAIAAITLLTKLQGDLLNAESEAMTNLITNVDIGDVRVNELNAYVIPTSNMIMRGGKYSANIVLAAIDTTQRPRIFVGGKQLTNPKGLFEFVGTTVGTHEYSGYIEVTRGDGTTAQHPFKSSYTVIEPMATISATMMNVLYAGINNPISISVPGVPMNAVQATMTNGTLTRNGDTWIAQASKVGSEATISVSAQLDGRSQQVGQMTFRVRKLPDPTAYIAMRDGSGNTVHYKGSPKRISKAALMSADGLGAAIDDDLLNVTYTVVSFSTVFFDSMGNAIPEVSAGSKFSERQKEQFKRLKPGKSFFISNVKAKGPDGITRDISPMEVALN